ncbi:ribonuclease [Rhizobium sp. KVB221]|uniref:Ribonuclease n=1 Tax=Rhizobium setariae TaxID=2801340 RepID=A0A936YN23_9HYPH|nr:ribonuclease [Rhizobium setariae]MBL0371276.1 ribonuclease [Rhizobium setariae]
MRQGLLTWLLGLLLAAHLSLIDAGRAKAADFDYYVLSLSWSPSWCSERDPGGRTSQCNGKRRYGFIAHGLWPQNERSWPENCESPEPGRVPDALARSLNDIIPSAGLAGHEWRKHGTCSGLSQRAYFNTLRAAYAKIVLPQVIFNGAIDRNISTDQIESLMIRANPGLKRDALAVTCDDGQISELRICMTKSLGFTSCPAVDRRACRQRNISIPAIQ